MNNNVSISPTAPPVTRTPMRPRPWFGLLRGFLAALMPGVPFFWNLDCPPDWVFAAKRRRRVLLLLVALLAGVAATLMAQMAPADAGVVWMLYATLGVLMLAWVGAGLATALMSANRRPVTRDVNCCTRACSVSWP